MNRETDIIAVSGATGYVGGRLVPRLLEMGWRVRAVGRSREKLEARAWSRHPRVELVEINMLDEKALVQTLKGCSVFYYLVHSMNPEQRDFAKADDLIAGNAARAAAAAGVQRIIYLGGLGEEGKDLSKHLLSRAKVAAILQSGPVPVTVLRAAMIIGSGSASFEMLRYLVDRLPVMLTPRWIDTPNEPIAVRNVLGYLIGCLENLDTRGQTFDVGSGEVVTYRQLMQAYAEQAGLARRLIIACPFIPLKISSLWIHIITPIPASLAGPLVEGLRNPVVCRDRRIQSLIPQKLIPPQEAIRLALNRYDENLETHWSDAGELPPVEFMADGDPCWSGGTIYQDKREVVIPADSASVWRVIEVIGGKTGWYHATWLWRLRGWIDRWVGGPGFRMGRRDAVDIKTGDALDFWRVAGVRHGAHLRLVAEMKLPGRAVLEFRISAEKNGTRLQQIASFRPRGLAGILYWYLVMPFHEYVFGGLIRKIALRATGSKKMH